MSRGQARMVRSITSNIEVAAAPKDVWQQITNVQIEQFDDPLLFRLLGIPKPLRAEIVSEGVGGQRIAYFNINKRFVQEITAWNPYREYSFNFNPEKGFRVGHFMDLADGVFQLGSGSYYLQETSDGTNLQLHSTYSLDRRTFWLLNLPVRLVTKAFQRYLLASIKKNSEAL